MAEVDSTSNSLLQELRVNRRRLAVEYAKPMAERKKGWGTGEEAVNIIEKELASTISGFSQAAREVDWQAVQAQLGPGEFAVEFIRYQWYEIEYSDSVMYVALLLKPGAEAPQFIPLFEERALQKLMASGQGLQNTLYAFASRGIRPGEKVGGNLQSLNWQPLLRELEGAENHLFCSGRITASCQPRSPCYF